MNEAKNHKKVLSFRIRQAAKSYYEGEPIISDADFDYLVDKLRAIDPDNEVLKDVGAPVESKHLSKAKHELPMYSLAKVNTKEDFKKWAHKTGSELFVVTEKFDGLSIELVYKEGKLKQGITRGDGTTGEDVTRSVQQAQWVERTLHFSGSLRGEIIIAKSDFEEHFKSDDYSNPRNAAAGFVRRKKLDSRLKYLQVKYFNCLRTAIEFTTKEQQFNFMEGLGVKLPQFKITSIEGVIKLYDYYQETRRDKLDYEIDGLVIETYSLTLQEQLGVVDNRPKGAIAWKFPAKGTESTVKEITWEGGKTGRITPVCHIEPVEVGGVIVSKASVYNLAYVTDLGIGKGAKVLVVRAGDVIPRIEAVLELGEQTDPPTNCPSCNTELVEEGEYILCPNEQCPGRRLGDFQKWVEVAEIEEAGPAFLQDVMSTNLFEFDVEDISDLYKLKAEDLMLMEGYKKTKASKIIRNINKNKKLPLGTILAGLNIPNVGRRVCKKVVEAGFDNLDDLYEVSIEELEKLEGIGSVKAKLFHEGIRNKRKVLAKLLRNGVKIMEKKQGKLTGQSFCFTGALSIKRNNAKRMVEDLGGEFKSAVSKGLTYLVQPDATSQTTKAKKARDLGTEVIEEDAFMKMVDFDISSLE